MRSRYIWCLGGGAVVAAMGLGLTLVPDMAARASLQGDWRLTATPDLPEPPDRRYPMRVTFAPGGRLTGHDGCNRFEGVYRTKGATLVTADVSQTLRACHSSDDPYLEARERAFRRALANASFKVEGDALV